MAAPTTLARGSFTSANFKEDCRVAYNTLVRKGAEANGYVVLDIAGDSLLLNPSDGSVFYSDGIHLNKAGGIIKRQIDDPAITSAFA